MIPPACAGYRLLRPLRGAALTRFVAAVALAIALCGVTARDVTPARAATGNVLYSPNISANPNEDASYPRVIRLAHSGAANGTLLAAFSHSGDGNRASFPIYQSTDGGGTWSSSPIGVVRDTVHNWDLDGPTLFELPQAEGPYPAGTLLAAGTAWVHNDYTQQAIEVFRSADQGHTWAYLSSCASESGLANTIGHGIWEPEFQIDSAGHLVCYFSDERQSGAGYNQLLGHVISTDGGQTWGSEVYDVAVQDNVQRPGMTIVVKLPNGQYMMSFEDCKAGYDPDQACSVYVKTSSDGDNWTPVNSLGALVQTSDGRHLLHTPYLAWSPAGGPDGTLIISGQRLVTGPDGSLTVLPESGRTLLVNTNLGVGPWSELPAPFVIDPTGGYDSGETSCPGYSSPLLPSQTGTSVLYLAGTHIANGKCEVRFGTASIGTLPFYAPFAGGTDAGWTTYGGAWSDSATNESYSDSSSGPGDKSVAGSPSWGNYTLQGDVEVTASGQAGLIARVTNPSVGADAFDGYYLGVETSGDAFLGRENGAWHFLNNGNVPGGVATNTWYHLTLQVVGSTLTATAQNITSPDSVTFTATDTTFSAGAIGVRDNYTTGAWRNIAMTPR